MLNKIPGPFLVAIMALDFNEDDPQNLVKSYEHFFGPPFPGYVLPKGLKKDVEEETPAAIADLILGPLREKKILSLVLLWENLVDRAKDLSMKNLVRVEVENAIIELIQSIWNELGDKPARSATRQLVQTMMTLVSRNVTGGTVYEKLDALVQEISKMQRPTGRDPRLYHHLMFYQPLETEGIWTGEIYKVIEQTNCQYEYAIVMTPPCDIVQGKATSMLMCFGFAVKEECIEDTTYPPYVIDPSVSKKISNMEWTRDRLRAYVKERYLAGGQSLPDRLYRVRHFADDMKGQPFDICFDFNNVRTVPPEDLKKWKRICRLDSPFIDEMMQKYGTQAGRIGTPDWSH